MKEIMDCVWSVNVQKVMGGGGGGRIVMSSSNLFGQPFP